MNQQKIIFHIDVNSAFLSWSALKLLEEGTELDIRTIPSIVGGNQKNRHGIVLAKSIPAKKYGIHTAETVASAFQKCPNLINVSPDHAYYREKSRKLMEFLGGLCPVIEQVSVDECYLSYNDLKNDLGDPINAATIIKDQIYDIFGFTVNVGISDRKVLAKMASDFQKPNKVHTLYHNEIKEKMWPLPIEELYMCGKSSSDRLRKMGILTIGDLAQMDLQYIESIFKSHGKLLWKFANGVDDSIVNPIREKAKGVGNSTTLAYDLTTKEEVYPILKKLARSVSQRLEKKQFEASSICVEIKYHNFQSASHQKQLLSATNNEKIIYKESCQLFMELWTGEPIRLLGIRTTKLRNIDEPVQLNLFEYEKQVVDQQKKKKLDEAMKKIQLKFGDDIIQKGF